MLRAVVFAVALVGLQSVAHADVYRWVDAQGRVQYSDKWMPGSELVKVDKSKPDQAAAAASQNADKAKFAASNARIAEQQAEAAKAQAVKQDTAKAQADQCAEAKQRYDKAIHARRIFREGKDGNKEYISDAEADAYRLKARGDMDAACGTSK
jgi:hypothetical protein